MELQTFNSTQFGELRTAEIEGKIYYCGNDVFAPSRAGAEFTAASIAEVSSGAI